MDHPSTVGDSGVDGGTETSQVSPVKGVVDPLAPALTVDQAGISQDLHVVRDRRLTKQEPDLKSPVGAPTRSVGRAQAAEGERKPLVLRGRNAVLPLVARCASKDVDRSRHEQLLVDAALLG
jgi:hypothetical protein